MSGYFSRTVMAILLLTLTNKKAHAQSFKFLIPDEAIVQFAGSIGYVSAGVGYELFKNKRGNLDLLYGFVPGNKGGVLNIATMKFAYKPWMIKIKDWAKIYPVNPGVFVSYTFHEELSYRFSTDQYPKGYYFWSEALRPHLSISNEVELNARKLLKGSAIKAISVYSELNTNDYYLINYFQSMSALNPSDIFALGLGLRLKF